LLNGLNALRITREDGKFQVGLDHIGAGDLVATSKRRNQSTPRDEDGTKTDEIRTDLAWCK
jgi:hypothetical protein